MAAYIKMFVFYKEKNRTKETEFVNVSAEVLKC